MAASELQHRDVVYVRRIGFWSKPKVGTISGEARFAGKYILTEYDERLSSLVERCGGLSQDAFLEGVRSTRTWEEESRRVALDMEEALSGDDIYIPPSNLAANVRGQVTIPGVVQHLPRKGSRYYADMVGGYRQNADVSNSHIIRANGLILKATRRFWFDPEVPPGSTLVVPEKAPGGPLWRHPRPQGFVVGIVASVLVWYGTN